MNHSISREVPISLIIIVCESIPEVSLEKSRLRIDKNKIFLPVYTLKRCSFFFSAYVILKILLFFFFAVTTKECLTVSTFSTICGERSHWHMNKKSATLTAVKDSNSPTREQ